MFERVQFHCFKPTVCLAVVVKLNYYHSLDCLRRMLRIPKFPVFHMFGSRKLLSVRLDRNPRVLSLVRNNPRG